MVAREKPSDGVVKTDAGLIVPGHAVSHGTESGPKAKDLAAVAIGPDGKANLATVAEAIVNRGRGTAYDPDTRRRVGLTRREAKTVQQAVDILNHHGVGVLLACSARFDGKEPCGGWLTPEGRRGRDADAGFGCTCTRIHFLDV